MIREGFSIGALPVETGVHFCVWAPEAELVEVLIGRGEEELAYPLERDEEGYHSGVVLEATVGSRYRYRLDGGESYPDPASRFQPMGVDGPSEVVDPENFLWTDQDWEGLSHEELVIYELHIGTFSPEGTFTGAIPLLDHVVELGATAIEFLPIANFSGSRNWGYDGVDPFAPATAYGRPEEFKQLVNEAHSRGLAVILDVVYNHLGPAGNYIPAVTGGRFFTDKHHTPWGDGINYDGPGSRAVREFIFENALHWLTEYHVDGLRLDATHAIVDDSEKHVLAELVERVRELPGRHRFLFAEDERNERSLILPREAGGVGLDGVWADDIHHQLRRAAAGDSEGYFSRYTGRVEDIVTTLKQGWWRTGSQLTPEGETEEAEGTPTDGIEPKRFVHCLQNHDQVGNRAFGNRLNDDVPLPVYRALSALLLAAPSTPLLWMGQEWAASSPFLYFTDHSEELGKLVTDGRREEFKHFSAFQDPEVRETIPDPQSPETFEKSKLKWAERAEAPHAGVLNLYRELLAMRKTEPALRVSERELFDAAPAGEGAVMMRREDGEGGALLVVVNLRGEIGVDLKTLPIARLEGDRHWAPVLATEEMRFAGDGAWGRYEAEGTLHLMQPGAVILRSR